MYYAGFKIPDAKLVVFYLCNFFSNSRLIYDDYNLSHRKISLCYLRGLAGPS
jgi:hypothetical protein